jgi:hypothetical protein
MLDVLSAEEFEALSGRPLVLYFGDHPLNVQVIEVRRFASPTPRKPQAFAVVLRADGATRSGPQGMYRLELPERGTLEIFAVAIGPDDQGMRYEVIFN